MCSGGRNRDNLGVFRGKIDGGLKEFKGKRVG